MGVVRLALPALARRSWPGLPLPSLTAWLGLLAGSVCLAYAFSEAATRPGDHYDVFWLGILAFTLPAGVRLASAGAARGERLSLLIALGLFFFLPKFLRNPDAPLYHDELVHFRQAEAIRETGRLFEANPVIEVVGRFPGLHAPTAMLGELTGLGTFAVGTILLVTLHAVALLGVFVLVERLSGSARVAAVAGVIYALNPSYMYFDAQYSYESLAIVLFVWVLVAAVGVAQAGASRGARAGWAALGLVLAGLCVVTHHLTSLGLAGMLVLASLLHLWAARRTSTGRDAALALGAFTLAVVGMLAGWLVLLAPEVLGYIGPRVTDGVEQLRNMANREESSRVLFAKSTLPAYERACSVLAVLVAAGLTALALWRSRRDGIGAARAPMRAAFVLLALAYFASLPFILSEAGAEGARRSWAFSYLGLAVVIAPAVVWLLDRAGRAGRAARATVRLGLLAVLVVVLVGNVAASLNETYRFPGPYVYGSDTRSLTPELLAFTSYFERTQGRGQRVVADRYAGTPLAAFAGAETSRASRGFPVYELYFQAGPPSPLLMRLLATSNWRYLVIDKQMARQLPLLGIYLDRNEPGAQVRTAPPPAAALEKFERLPWAIKLFESDNFELYRFDFRALPGPLSAGQGRER